MIAKLPLELVEELERAGDRPLQVENPASKRLYVLADVEHYDVIRRSSRAPAASPGWSDEMNERRCALIREKFAKGIDADQARELADLQDQLSAYRKQAVPLPYDVIDILQAAVNSSPPTS